MTDVQVMHGDCRELMAGLPDGSVDAIVTDPPYGQTNEAYDSPIAFDANLWRECFRVAKPDAVLLSFAGSPTYHRIATAIESGGWKVRQMWGWVYADGLITSAWPKEGFDRLAPAMDPICYATKGKVLLNLEREGNGVWARSASGRGMASYSERASSQDGLLEAKGRWPKTLVSDGSPGFEFFNLARTSSQFRLQRTIHPNQKPLALIRWLVSKLPPGGLTLDPFVGSGSTLVACMKAGRPCIGMESDPRWHPVIARRVADARTPLFDGAAP